MQLSKLVNRLIAARSPFSVVEIKDDSGITRVNGKQSSFRIVNSKKSGIANFGCDERAAQWFCDAANRYANEIQHHTQEG